MAVTKSVPESVFSKAPGIYYKWQWQVCGGFYDRICF